MFYIILINWSPGCQKTQIAEISKTQEARNKITTRYKVHESMLGIRHLK